MLRRADDSAHWDYVVLANFSPKECVLDLAVLAPYLEGARRAEWQAPLLSTLARDFGGSGALPQSDNDKPGMLTLPPRGLFLYELQDF